MADSLYFKTSRFCSDAGCVETAWDTNRNGVVVSGGQSMDTNTHRAYDLQIEWLPFALGVVIGREFDYGVDVPPDMEVADDDPGAVAVKLYGDAVLVGGGNSHPEGRIFSPHAWGTFINDMNHGHHLFGLDLSTVR